MKDWIARCINDAPLKVRTCLANCEMEMVVRCGVNFVWIEPRSKIAASLLEKPEIWDWIESKAKQSLGSNTKVMVEKVIDGTSYRKMKSQEQQDLEREALEDPLVKAAITMGGKVRGVRKI